MAQRKRKILSQCHDNAKYTNLPVLHVFAVSKTEKPVGLFLARVLGWKVYFDIFIENRKEQDLTWLKQYQTLHKTVLYDVECLPQTFVKSRLNWLLCVNCIW